MSGPKRSRPLRPASLRGRVVLAVLALLAVLLTVLFVVVDLLLDDRLHSDLRTRLTDRIALAEQLDGALRPQQLVDRLRGDGVAAVLCSPRQSAGTGTRCVQAASGPLPPAAKQAGGGPPAPSPAARPGAPVTAQTVRSTGPDLYVRTTLPSTGQVLTLSVDSSQVAATLNRLVLLEIVAGVVALLLAAALLIRLVGTALRPLDHLTSTARRIAGGERGRRLGSGRPDTELGRTATAFDAMLDELESALESRAAAERRLRDFLGDVSHELRTPLTGLAATSETLLRDEPDRAAREQSYVALVRETRRAQRLVEDLLTVARLDTGAGLNSARVDLRDVVGVEVERQAALAPAVSVRVCTPGAAPVDADAERLGQVLANLLANARTATGAAGHVAVTVAPSGAGTTTAPCWVVEVRDDGPGVPAADAERIFERLVRLDPARDRRAGGFGLGLPIARALARAHGGDLVCVPQPPGEGARFRLTLPMPSDVVTSPHAAADPAPTDG